MGWRLGWSPGKPLKSLHVFVCHPAAYQNGIAFSGGEGLQLVAHRQRSAPGRRQGMTGTMVRSGVNLKRRKASLPRFLSLKRWCDAKRQVFGSQP